MSKAEILAELPKLKPEDRDQVFQKLCELQDADLVSGIGSTDEERRLLDKALEEYECDRDPGIPWRQALSQIRKPAGR
jgi:hypothetical protein